MRRLRFMWFLLGVLLLTVLDQWTKILARTFLMGKEGISLIPGILHLSYLYPENRGIAFGLFQNGTPVFVILTLGILLAIFLCLLHTPRNRRFLPLWLGALLVCAGAIGNLIDRVARHYVIDFLYLPFLHFPVFNLADVYVVVGVILVMLLLLFYYKEEEFVFLRKH